MHKVRKVVEVASITLGLLSALATAGTNDAAAKPPAKVAAGPANVNREIRLAPVGLEWGQNLQMVARVYDDALDMEYVPIFKRTEPGIEAQRLDAELAEKKSLIRRHRLDFGNQPTGVDEGPLAGEYSYSNGESMTKTMLNGSTTRYFFFHGDRLWKVYDEYKLGKRSPFGDSFEQAVKAMSELVGGVAPQLLEPDSSKMRSFGEAVWSTRSMNIRLINRESNGVVAVAWSDRSVHEKLSQTRMRQKSSVHKMDPAVRDVTTRDTPQSPSDKAADEKKKK